MRQTFFNNLIYKVRTKSPELQLKTPTFWKVVALAVKGLKAVLCDDEV